jgi:hypothetical protein
MARDVDEMERGVEKRVEVIHNTVGDSTGLVVPGER